MELTRPSLLELGLRAAAIAQFGIALLNLSLVRVMKWKPDLDRLPLLIREVFQVHLIFISVTVATFAVLTWRFAREMATGTIPVAVWLAAGDWNLLGHPRRPAVDLLQPHALAGRRRSHTGALATLPRLRRIRSRLFVGRIFADMNSGANHARKAGGANRPRPDLALRRPRAEASISARGPNRAGPPIGLLVALAARDNPSARRGAGSRRLLAAQRDRGTSRGSRRDGLDVRR